MLPLAVLIAGLGVEGAGNMVSAAMSANDKKKDRSSLLMRMAKSYDLQNKNLDLNMHLARKLSHLNNKVVTDEMLENSIDNAQLSKRMVDNYVSKNYRGSV